SNSSAIESVSWLAWAEWVIVVFVALAVRVLLRTSYRRHLETRPIQQIGPEEATDNGTLLAQRHGLFRPKINYATRGGTVADERRAGDRSVGGASGPEPGTSASAAFPIECRDA